MINNIIINSSTQNKRKFTENISTDTNNDLYVHDIGKWALVKFCNYPQDILYSKVNNIPPHVIKSLQ